MCDYSLHATPNRLAVDGEQLVAHRFPTGSMGLASPAELYPKAPDPTTGVKRSWWTAIKNWLHDQASVPPRVCAVCIPPGAQLIVHDIPVHLQQELGVSESEAVVFTQLSASEYRYRDGVRFSNGREILLQSFQEGMRVDVVSLALKETTTEAAPREVPVWNR